MSTVALNEVVERAAFELVGLPEPDQGACIAAACESVAEWLVENRPDLTDEEIRSVCVGLAKRVKARLSEVDTQPASAALH